MLNIAFPAALFVLNFFLPMLYDIQFPRVAASLTVCAAIFFAVLSVHHGIGFAALSAFLVLSITAEKIMLLFLRRNKAS